MKDYISIQLFNPIKLSINKAGKNTFEDLETLYAKCWNLKEHRNITRSLRNQFKRLPLSLQDILPKQEEGGRENKEENKKISAKEINDLLSIVDHKELEEFSKTFQSFLSKNILFKDEELTQPVNAIDLEKLSIEDEENIISKYIEVFFVLSWKI